MAVKRIDEHTLKVLEFDQILQILAAFAASSLGRDAALALYPSLDADWIQERICETSEAKSLLEQGTKIPLAGLRDIGPLLRDFGRPKGIFDPADLLQIADTLSAAARVRDFFAEVLPEKAPCLKSMAEKLGDFSPIVDEINRCVEDEKKLRENASEKLQEITRRINELTREIERRFKHIVSSPEMRKVLENDQLLMRHGRVVVAVRSKYRQHLRGIVLDRSNTGATVFVEPEQLVELSNELEDATFAREKEISRILWELTHAVIEKRREILASLTILASFDLANAKARFSLEYEMAAPAMCDEPVLNLRQARHPLLIYCISLQKACSVSQAVNDVVPIDIRLGDDFDLLLVTGPNTGGKTVMLKTIGLLALMAQSGMHIPAHPDSRVTVYRQVFADIGDEQSIQQSLSTFSAHV